MKNDNRKKDSKTPKQISQPIVKYRMRNFNNRTIENSYKEYKKLGLTCSTVKLLENATGEKHMQVFYKFNSITLSNCLNYCKSKDNCICILTGERSKIIILDIDQKDKGMDMWNKLIQDNKEPDTLKVRSGNRGVHFYFKLDDRTSLLKNKSRLTIRNTKVGIDVRSEKGIIFAPPTKYFSMTTGESKSYKFLNNKSINKMPGWLWDELNHIDNIITIVKKKNILIKPTNKIINGKINNTKRINNSDYIQTLNQMSSILANIKNDRFESRDKWIKLGMILHHEFKGDNVGLNIWKTYSWYKDECLAKWKSFNINNTKQLTKSKLLEWQLEDRIENKLLNTADAGDYVKFIGKVVDYGELKKFIKKTYIYIFDGGNAFWITKNIVNNEIKYQFLKDLSAFNKKFIKYKNLLFNINDDNSKPLIRKSFANILEEVSHELQYKLVDFIPHHENVDKNIFNLFTSFKAQRSNDDINESKIDKILWHIRYIWCKNNDDLYDYIINWLAHLMQKPHKKIDVAILLKSKQGAGKNLLWQFIADSVIGRQYSLVLGDIDRLFCRFNAIMQNRLLTILDEISNYGGAYKSNDKLKNLITQTEQVIEFKGLKPIRFSDYNNYIFLSNNDWPIKVEQSDRRFFCLDLDNCKCGNSDYFDTLAKQLNVDSANIFYNYLLNINISNWNKLKIPTTGLKNELKINSLHKPIQFLIKCVEGEIDTVILSKDKSTKVHTKELYELFIDHFGYRSNISKIEFSRQLNKFGLKSKLVRISGSRLNGYVLDYNKIVSKLKDLKIEILVVENDVDKNDSKNNGDRKMEIIKINDLDY